MKRVIGIPYYSEKYVDSYREGLGVYTKFLTMGILDRFKDISVEIWCYHNNYSNVKKLFQDIEKKYPERIRYLDEFSVSNKSLIGRLYMFYFRALCKIGIEDNDKIPRSLERKYPPYPKWMKNYFYYKMLDKSKADWVYYFSPQVECRYRFKKPVILQIHDLFPIAYRREFKDEIKNIDDNNKALLSNIKKFEKLNKKIVCSSNYTKKSQCLKYLPYIGENDIEVIPFIPMIKKYETRVLDEEKVFDKFKIKKKYIFYPTENRSNKNIITLLKALNILKENGTEIIFVTTGKISTLRICEDYVNEKELRDYIYEVGTVTDEELYVLYRNSNVVVSTSFIEGAGISGQVLEALSIGNIPVISAKNDGIEELLKTKGTTFENTDLNWFDKYDYVKLAERITDVITNPVPHIKKQKHIIKLFTDLSWEDVAEQYVNIFYKIEK